MSGLLRSYGPHPQTAVEEAALAYDGHIAALESAKEHATACIEKLSRVRTAKAQELTRRCRLFLEFHGELPHIDAQEWLDAIAEAREVAA